MPAPRWFAHFNHSVTNRFTRRFAGRLPGFGIVTHTGRKSGREYRTPVNVFKRKDGYRIALTFGSDAQWVRNVVSNGGCKLETRGHERMLTDPHMVHDEQRRAIPAPVRFILGLLDVSDFLDLRNADEPQVHTSVGT